MAKPQETRQEQETRWAAQRAAREQELQAGQQTRRTKNRRTWVIVAVLVLIVAGIATALLR
jgi:hypothetical protein